MKKTISFILSLIMVWGILTSVAMTVNAASESDLTFELNEDGKSYSVTDCDESAEGELAIPKTYNGLPVISIGDWAFSGCKNLASVTLSNGVKSIGAYAFEYCYSLISVILSDSVTDINHHAFFSCTSLQSITIPVNVKSIGYYAFKDCPSLTSINVSEDNIYYSSLDEVLFDKEKTTLILHPSSKTSVEYTIPESVIYIEDSAFDGCSNLTLITALDNVVSIGDYAFNNCASLTSIEIPDSVKSIGDYAFNNCASLTSIEIPDSVTSIGQSAFNNTAYYNDLSNWENNVLYIGNHLIKANTILSGVYEVRYGTKTIAELAFYNCSELTFVKIPFGVTNIESSTFENCISLTSVIIPNSVTSISFSAFYNCSRLTSIKIPEGARNIGQDAFCGCTNLSTIVIPDSVTNIGLRAFYNTEYYNNPSNWENGVLYISNHLTNAKTSLKGDYKIKQGTISIGEHVFSSCSNLESIIIPESVTVIGMGAFYHCTSLNSVTIPESVKYIGSKAFGYYFDNTSTNKKKDFIICGIKNSEAEIYAKENGFSFIEICEHKSSSWITDEEATVYKAGEKVKKCTACGIELDRVEIPQLECAKPVLKKVYNANSYVKVTWGTVKGADLYRVYRKTGTGEYEYIGSTANAYYNDKGAGAGKTCRYIVKAKNEAGNSDASASLVVKHIDEPTLKSIENSAYGVLIKWDKVTGAEKYNVYRKVSGGEYQYIGATSNTYYTDKTAKSGTKYYYAIRGKRDDSVSSQSASLSKYYLEDPILNAPTSTSEGIGLRWSKVTGAEGYMVYRKTSNGSYKRITTEKGVSNVTFRDTTAKKGTKYYYKVKAYYSKTYSEYSNTKSITDKY